jgi:ABC-type Fe3+ transport system permease subunit
MPQPTSAFNAAAAPAVRRKLSEVYRAWRRPERRRGRRWSRALAVLTVVLDGTALGLGVHLAQSAAGLRAWGHWGALAVACVVAHAALRAVRTRREVPPGPTDLVGPA